MSEHVDKKLVKQLLTGTQAAFDEFFNFYFPKLYRFVLPRVGHDPDLAEEVVQIVMGKAVYKLHTYRGEASLYTWLCAFCRHEVSAQWKQRSHYDDQIEFAEDHPAIQAALESLSIVEASPDLLYGRYELGRLVQVTLDHLPEIYSKVLECKYLQGMSMQEIADHVGRSVKAVESILSRARNAFRDGFSALAQADSTQELIN